MIPGINPRQLQHMMRQMGMSQEDLEVEEVVIKTPTKKLVFKKPSVQKVTMQGQTTFQVIGDYTEEIKKAQVNISKEDIEIVAKEANVSEDEAKRALEKSNGDIAEAIVNLG